VLAATVLAQPEPDEHDGDGVGCFLVADNGWLALVRATSLSSLVD
jgi:hypothetical protein